MSFSDQYVPKVTTLAAAPDTTLHLPNAIGWKRASDGAMIAYVEGIDNDGTPSQAHGGTQHLEGAALVAQTKRTTDQAIVLLQTGDIPTGRGGASVTVAHEDLTNPTPVAASVQAVAAPQLRTIIKQDGTSDFTQVMTQSGRNQRMSNPAEVYFSGTYNLPVVGWQNIPMTNINYDPDGLLNWNGTSYALFAPTAGYYRCEFTVSITNNTGANLDVLAGFNSSWWGARTTIGSLWTWGGAISRTFLLNPGTQISGNIWISALGGFGVALASGNCWFSCQRVA